jgi:hypothetical protein
VPDRAANVLLTCAGQRVDIVRAFRRALAAHPGGGRVLVSDLDPLSPSLYDADLVVDLPPRPDPGTTAARVADRTHHTSGPRFDDCATSQVACCQRGDCNY